MHWNLKEIEETLPKLINKVQKSYFSIGKKLGVSFHNNDGIEKFKKQFLNGVSKFMITSRNKAQEAQNREQQTLQPKEFLLTSTKATITIRNYIGGHYYFTTDEVEIKNNTLYLIEGKHSSNSKLPSIGDIKDGLLKMILYCNLTNVQVDNKKFIPKPILKLTSSELKGNISSINSFEEIYSFYVKNGLNEKQIKLLKDLFQESSQNNFIIIIEKMSE